MCGSKLEVLRQHALNKDGQLLSTKYINCKLKLLWECKNKHIWKATWDSVKHGNWCSSCSGKIKPTLLVLQQYAISHSGKLISTEYNNKRTKLTWQCKEGHQWKVSWGSIKSKNRWCPVCAGNAKPEINSLQQYAINKGGKLLSNEYTNARTKLSWECKEEHHWKANWDSISHGCWCPYCAKTIKPEIKDLQQYAINKKGKLLSNDYINNHMLLVWQCSKNHIWNANWNSIYNQNTWCPECSSFKNEHLCKQLLEQNLNIVFKKTRFYYDKYKYYEFDGYNEEHKIAFEYHGIQHYKYPNFFHKTEATFLKQQSQDTKKEQYCIDNNIKLIIIPHNIKNIEKYITEFTCQAK